METTENEARQQAGEDAECYKWTLLALWHGWNQMARVDPTLEGRAAFRALRTDVQHELEELGAKFDPPNGDDFIPIRLASYGEMTVNFLPSDIEQMREAVARFDVARFDAQNCGGTR